MLCFTIPDPNFTEKFWLVHDVARLLPLSVGIKQVQEFLKQSGDIVIWRTSGFNQVIF